MGETGFAEGKGERKDAYKSLLHIDGLPNRRYTLWESIAKDKPLLKREDAGHPPVADAYVPHPVAVEVLDHRPVVAAVVVAASPLPLLLENDGAAYHGHFRQVVFVGRNDVEPGRALKVVGLGIALVVADKQGDGILGESPPVNFVHPGVVAPEWKEAEKRRPIRLLWICIRSSPSLFSKDTNSAMPSPSMSISYLGVSARKRGGGPSGVRASPRTRSTISPTTLSSWAPVPEAHKRNNANTPIDISPL